MAKKVCVMSLNVYKLRTILRIFTSISVKMDNFNEKEKKVVEDMVKLCKRYSLTIKINGYGASNIDDTEALSDRSDDTISSNNSITCKEMPKT